VQAYINANAYKAKRAAEYPSIPDQFDLLYHGGMDAWKTAIQAVKNKYPKHKIDDASLVSFSNGDLYYEVDILSPAKEKESEVLIREDGKFVMKGEDL
jgi:uncharacterized membrane protein YkoI